MDLPRDIQERVMEELQSDRTIVFIMSSGGVYLSLLGGANRKLYSNGSHLIGKNYKEVLQKNKAAYFQSLIDRVIETEGILEEEYELEVSDFLHTLIDGPRNTQRFHSTIIPFRVDESSPLERVLWIVRNITDKKRI